MAIQSERMVNVGETERVVSAVAGGALLVFGLRRMSLGGLTLAAIGAALGYRAVTGHCDVYERLGIDAGGAHRNVGLGHDFLRHIVRCRLLIFVLDAAGSEGRNPIEDLGTLRRELDLYDPRLSQRPWVIVANKMDLPEAQANLEALRHRFPDKVIVPISAATGEGIPQFLAVLEKFLAQS